MSILTENDNYNKKKKKKRQHSRDTLPGKKKLVWYYLEGYWDNLTQQQNKQILMITQILTTLPSEVSN